MGIQLIRTVDRMAVRRVGDRRPSPRRGKTGRNDGSTLHRRSCSRSKSPCRSPQAVPSRRNYRSSSSKNSGRDRSKSSMVEKPLANNLVLENVVILKRQSVSKNHQPAVSVMPPSSPPGKPVGGAAPDRCSVNPIQGKLENVVKLRRQSVSKNNLPVERVMPQSSPPEKPVGGVAPDRCSVNPIQGELENVVKLKRQSVSRNHQSVEIVMPPSSPPEEPVGGAASDRCSANPIQGELENVGVLKRQSVSKNHPPAESVMPPSSPPEKPVRCDPPDLCSANQIQGELEDLLRNISPVKPQLYAGAGFFTSPAPSSLPKPSFFEKKEVASSLDLATKSLSFLLCLDVV